MFRKKKFRKKKVILTLRSLIVALFSSSSFSMELFALEPPFSCSSLRMSSYIGKKANKENIDQTCSSLLIARSVEKWLPLALCFLSAKQQAISRFLRWPLRSRPACFQHHLAHPVKKKTLFIFCPLRTFSEGL